MMDGGERSSEVEGGTREVEKKTSTLQTRTIAANGPNGMDKTQLVVSNGGTARKNVTTGTASDNNQLICKTPTSTALKRQQSSAKSVTSSGTLQSSVLRAPAATANVKKHDPEGNTHSTAPHTLYLGLGQILLGIGMIAFGIMAILHRSSLAQIGGGLWGGCIVLAAGITGTITGAENWCPLRSTPKQIVHTSFLALTLVSFGVAQLVAAVAATGLARDISKEVELTDSYAETESEQWISAESQSPLFVRSQLVPESNFYGVTANIAILLISLAECVLSAVAAYRSARILCSCFRKSDGADHPDNGMPRHQIYSQNTLVRSWLGCQNAGMVQPFYVVPASPLGAKITGHIPVMTAMPPPLVGYPALIPAPLGTIPPPPMAHQIKYIMPRRERPYHTKQRRMTHQHKAVTSGYREPPAVSQQPTDQTLNEQDLVKSYTGLDKTIAEEFIEICDSRNASVYSDSSCTSPSSIDAPSTITNGDTVSREFLVQTKL